MSTNTHVCPVAGCTRRLPTRILLCSTHWSRVPRALQREVYRTWNSGHPAPDYMTTRQQAIEAAQGEVER